jgi:hypothetical protein
VARRRQTHLTKTGYVNGLACKKWLWLAFNDPDRLPEAGQSVQFRLDEGRRVGEVARKRYPSGVLLPAEGPRENDRRTRSLLGKRQPLFEAGFLHRDGSCYARADVLLPVGENDWDVIEVKSGGSVQVEYLHDVAFQNYCYDSAGLKVRSSSLLLINTKYERSGEVDPHQLFSRVDITDAVGEVLPGVCTNVRDLLEVTKYRDCPEFGQGEPFHKDEDEVHADDAIWKKHPGADIQALYRGGKQSLALLESGVYRIKDIPRSVTLKGRQAIQYEAHVSDTVHVDRERLAAFVRKLKYPLHFLDFETVGTALPLFEGVRPYQQIPFQFSVHIVERPGEKARHSSFLSMEHHDPREGLLRALREAIGPKGHVVAYNQSFEKGALEGLAQRFPDYKSWVRETNLRFVDLITPFREFAYYSPAQQGSASLKSVLPAITGRGYDGFEIADGTTASLAYFYATFGTLDGKRTSPTAAGRIKEALEQYCGRDTEGMVWIVEKLTELSQLAA